MSSLAARVDWIVLGNIASGTRVTGQGIGRGAEDSVGETLDRLIDLLDDMRMGWGYGRDLCDQ